VRQSALRAGSGAAAAIFVTFAARFSSSVGAQFQISCNPAKIAMVATCGGVISE
jgi:hypothetical protein